MKILITLLSKVFLHCLIVLPAKPTKYYELLLMSPSSLHVSPHYIFWLTYCAPLLRSSSIVLYLMTEQEVSQRM